MSKGCVAHRNVPLVRVGCLKLESASKLNALQCLLVSRKTLRPFASFCHHVRSLATDMGVDRLPVDQSICVRRFMKSAFPGGGLLNCVGLRRMAVPEGRRPSKMEAPFRVCASAFFGLSVLVSVVYGEFEVDDLLFPCSQCCRRAHKEAEGVATRRVVVRNARPAAQQHRGVAVVYARQCVGHPAIVGHTSPPTM